MQVNLIRATLVVRVVMTQDGCSHIELNPALKTPVSNQWS